MGVVYRAEDLSLERPVTLKFLAPYLAADAEARQRLEHEARAASSLDHHNICAVYDIDADEEERTFIAMAYCEGEVLKDRIARGPLPVDEAVEIVRQAAAGLEAAHRQGIVHRDIKPGNLIVLADGTVKLVDFGLAKLSGASRLTRDGAMLGTVAYMSPEQARGEEVDHRTDVWSLTVVFYEMLAGHTPFRADHPQALIRKLLEEEPEPLERTVPEGLSSLLARGLTRDREQRIRTMGELSDALPPPQSSVETVLAAPSSALRSPASEAPLTATPSPPLPRRKGALVMLGTAALAVVVVAALFLGRQRDRAPVEVATSEPTADAAPVAVMRRLAVLPFTNVGGDADDDYLSFALADRVADRLGYVRGLVVRPSERVRQFAAGGVDLVSAARQLNADYLLIGTFAAGDELLELKVELVEASSSGRLWRDSVQVPVRDTFRLQEMVSDRVVAGFGLETGMAAGGGRVDVPGNPLAYEQYLRAVSDPDTADGNRLALEVLERSIALDRDYAPAHAELGNRRRYAAIYALGGTATAAEAEAAFDRALELNGELLPALSGLAKLKTELGDTEEAIELLRRSLAINPDHADSHFALSYSYRYAGMLEESAEEGELALALDPGNPRYRSVATTYLYLGDLQRSVEVHQLDPGSAWTEARLGQIRLRQGRRDEALAHLERAIAVEPESSTGRWAVAMRAYLENRPEEGLAAIAKNKAAGIVDGEQWYHMANIHGLFGDVEGCRIALAAAIDGGFFNHPFMLRDSLLDPVRDDPEIQRLIERARSQHEAFRRSL